MKTRENISSLCSVRMIQFGNSNKVIVLNYNFSIIIDAVGLFAQNSEALAKKRV